MTQLGSLRKIDTNNFSSGNMVPTKIPLIQYGRDLILYLRGTLTTGTTPTVAQDSPFSLLQAVDLQAVPSASGGVAGSLHRMTGMDMYVLNALETGNFGFLQRHGLSNATPYAFKGMIVIPFTDFPEDSLNLLPHPAFSNLELDVTWATLAALGTNIGAAFTVAPTLEIYETTRLNPPTATPNIMKTVVKTQALNASQDNIIDLKTGLPIQEVLIQIQDNGVRSDALCTSVSLIENDTISHVPPIPWDVLQAYTKFRGANIGPGDVGFGYPFVETGDNNTATAIGLGVSNPALITGYNFLDLLDIEGAPIPTANMDSFKLHLLCGTSAGGSPTARVVLRQRVG
jgi:hypothetical protein